MVVIYSIEHSISLVRVRLLPDNFWSRHRIFMKILSLDLSEPQKQIDYHFVRIICHN